MLALTWAERWLGRFHLDLDLVRISCQRLGLSVMVFLPLPPLEKGLRVDFSRHPGDCDGLGWSRREGRQWLAARPG